MPLLETGLLFRELASGQKQRVALSSVAAGAFLTAAKLGVAMTTGSLGLLAEAAHSGLDLLAALVTYLAVRLADRPADATHHYGHGKVEQLAALVEAVLLLLTCLWISYEAVERLLFRPVHVQPTLLAFAVLLVSIVVDWSRSRALSRAARAFHSQALEADALHFRTDIWSSAVVLLGLLLVHGSRAWGLPAELERADAAGGLVVAGVVAGLTLRLSRRAVDVLLDRAPVGLSEELAQAVSDIPEVMEVRSVRARQVGPRAFVDMTLGVSRTASVEQSHGIAEQAERRVRRIVSQADVTVHVEPLDPGGQSLVDQVRAAARDLGHEVHHVALLDVEGRLSVHLHLEVPANLTLQEAHQEASELETRLMERFAHLSRVETHIEPRLREAEGGRELTARLPGTVDEVRRVTLAVPGVRDCHGIAVRQVDGGFHLTLHVLFDGGSTMEQVHGLLEAVEQALRARFPKAAAVHIHPEPHPEAAT